MMKQEKKYAKPEANIIQFLAIDVIATSLVGDIGENDPVEQPGGGQE